MATESFSKKKLIRGGGNVDSGQTPLDVTETELRHETNLILEIANNLILEIANRTNSFAFLRRGGNFRRNFRRRGVDGDGGRVGRSRR